MRAMPAGQYRPGSSPLHRLDGRAKLTGFLLLIAAVVLTDTWAGYALMLLLTAAAVRCAGLRAAEALGPVRRLFPLFGFLFLLNAFFYTDGTPLWSWWIFTLSAEGMAQGGNVVLRILLVMVLGNLLTVTTPPLEITGALESLLRPLRLLRIPVEEVAMILSVAIQFIPTLLEETETIRKAQTARGARFESKKLRERAAAVLPLVVPIFLSAFKRADELSMAMEARGYRGAACRTPKRRAPLHLCDYAALTFCAALCALQTLI